MTEKPLRCVGIMTGGGDCPGLNAVIRAFVKTVGRHFPWQVIGIADGFEGLFREHGTRRLVEDDVRGLLPRGGTILGTSNRGDPFHYRMIVDGEARVVDRSQELMARMRDQNLDALVMIGGDGTMNIGLQVQALGMPVVGVPKTIDNDLSATDVTFGFDTAVQTATEAIDRLQSTAESHHRVMILEVMGRHSGFIALEAGIAGGVEIILIPEIPFDLDKIVAFIERRSRGGRTFSLIVVAEGAFPVGGKPLMLSGGSAGGAPRLGGIAVWLADQLGQRLRHDVRATVLGHVQRGGSPSPFDRVLATRFGRAAAHLVNRREFGKMVALVGSEIVAVPIEAACGVRKLVAPGSEKVMVARDLGISFGD